MLNKRNIARISVIALLLVMAVALSSCGKKEPVDAPAPDAPKEAPAVKEQAPKAEEPAPAPAEEVKEEVKEEAAAPAEEAAPAVPAGWVEVPF